MFRGDVTVPPASGPVFLRALTSPHRVTVVRGADNGIYDNHFDGATWGGWTAVGGTTSSRPAIVVE